jgi:GntR family transcriptional regulator, transcriptional repressor for pyruvate dehydrogenase complex
VQKEHIAVFEAIKAGDANGARVAVMFHLQRAAGHLELDIPSRDQETGMLQLSGRAPTQN